jgi:putative tryptophan/tyrosine transport system substrate-binding protein
LQRGLRELNYVEGQNIAIEYRFAEGKPEQLPMLAAELVRMKVDVIVAWGTQATLAAKQATTTIPIVMTGVTDPVKAGWSRAWRGQGATSQGQPPSLRI